MHVGKIGSTHRPIYIYARTYPPSRPPPWPAPPPGSSAAPAPRRTLMYEYAMLPGALIVGLCVCATNRWLNQKPHDGCRARTRDWQLLLGKQAVQPPEPGAAPVLVEGLHVGVPHPGQGRGAHDFGEQVLRVAFNVGGGVDGRVRRVQTSVRCIGLGPTARGAPTSVHPQALTIRLNRHLNPAGQPPPTQATPPQ
jgi:hypothetical protein